MPDIIGSPHEPAEPEMRHPAEVLRELLGETRGAQASLARALGVRPQTVTKWLSGETGIPMHRWPSIDRALGQPLFTIARRTGFLSMFPELERMEPEAAEANWLASFSTGTWSPGGHRKPAAAQPTASPAPIEERLATIEAMLTQLVGAVQELAAEVVALRDDDEQLPDDGTSAGQA